MFNEEILNDLVNRIAKSEKLCGVTRVITIDGPAGSGKTTLANQLSAKLLGCPVVHMDDLYNGWKQDLIGELADRITNQILIPLSDQQPGHYLRYDWHLGKFAESVIVSATNFLILEGVGSGHPKLHDRASLNIWVEANPQVLLGRLIKRDGQALQDELVKWQAHEARYFEQMSIKQLADVALSGD